MLLRALRPMRSVRAILVMVASWMSLVAVRPAAAAAGERELLATAAVDASVAAPAVRYSVAADAISSTRTSRAAPLALFLCAFALVLLAVQSAERARSEATAPPRVIDPRVVPHDAMAPPVLRLSLASL
jgi:hypothetical protein